MSAEMISAEVTGQDDLAAALNGIVKKARTAIGNEAVVTALTRVEMATKRHAEWSEETGALKESIGIKVKPYKKGAIIFGIVGPRKGFKRPDPSGKGFRDPVKYAHLVENGTSHSAPKAFMRPAFAETKNEMVQDIARVIGAGVAAEATRQAARRKNKGKP